jgi:hypothetical protein
MRDGMPTRWIEQAESRRVLTDALSERKPKPPPSTVAEDAVSKLPTRLRSWLCTRHPIDWVVSQARPR